VLVGRFVPTDAYPTEVGDEVAFLFASEAEARESFLRLWYPFARIVPVLE
jgi:hypothetical protein